MTDLEQRLTKLQKQFHSLRIMGGEGVTVYGSPTRGYAVEIKAKVAQAEVTGVEGCTDPTAINFNPDATVDDGSCEYETGACCENDFCFETDEISCTDDGGIFKGLGTTCADDNICPTGACCNFGCSFISPENCAFIGGDYQGDGVFCDPDPCPQGCCPGDGADCTEVPPADCTGTPLYGSGCEDTVCGCTDSEACNYNGSATVDDGSCEYPPSASLACDISYNSGSKCGFRVEGSPPHYYLTSEQDDVWTAASDQGGGQFCHGDANAHITFVGSGSVSTATTTSYDRDTCVLGDPSCSASGTLTLTRTVTGSNPSHCDDVFPSCVTYSFTPGCPDGSWSIIFNGARITTGSPCGVFTVLGPTTSTSYTDEYTTSDLISHVEDGLPAFPGTYDSGACCSSRSLSSDESTYSEQIAQYKFEFGTSTTDFQVDWVERFTPAGGGGSSDTPRSDTFSVGTTESGLYSLDAPGSNGTTCIEDVVVTCI